MLRTARAVAIALMLALVAAPALAKPKTGQPPKPPKKKESLVVGILIKVEATKLTVQTHGRNAGEVVVSTDRNTKFELEGKPAKLADIAPGLQVVASPATGVAQKVSATKIGKK
jgi:hypothetical protein